MSWGIQVCILKKIYWWHICFVSFTWSLWEIQTLNSRHRNSRFTYEKEYSSFTPFLDVLIPRTSNGFRTSVYHNPTFSWIYSNFNSFISEELYKWFDFHVIISNVFNCFEFLKSSLRRMWFKRILKKNTFPFKLIDSCIKSFMNKRLTVKPVILTA